MDQLGLFAQFLSRFGVRDALAEGTERSWTNCRISDGTVAFFLRCGLGRQMPR